VSWGAAAASPPTEMVSEIWRYLVNSITFQVILNALFFSHKK